MLDEDKATLLRVFSLSFAYPDDNLAGLVVSGVLQQDLFKLCTAVGLSDDIAGPACEKMMQYCNYNSEGAMHELRQEYTRLFLGRFPKVSHSEGVWICKKEGYENPSLIVNPRSLDVQKFQQSCGVVKADGYNDSIDTVEVECDFAAYLADGPEFPEELGRTSLQSYREFVDLHMKQWIPGFCYDVKCASDKVYYLSMADLLKEFISIA